MASVVSFFKKYRFELLLALIVGVVCILNYTPHTWLTGWDTLHPEVDFGLNIKRMFFGVFREEQGLGAIAGHSHMADLPRVIFLWIAHFALPIETLRYLWIFACLFIGVLGMFGLLEKLFKNKMVAFLGALFYFLNFGTVQQFFVPFEMFPTQYAFLPWIVLYSLSYIEGGKRALLGFAIVTLLSTPQAYAAQLWYAFFFVFLGFLGVLGILRKARINKVILLILVTVAINSFWLLPNLYYVKTSSSVPRFAKQNRLFSQEYRLRNREFGYLQDVSLLKGFYFDWNVYDFSTQSPAKLMPEWKQHGNSLPVQVVGYTFFGFVVAGIILSFKRKNRLFLAFTPFFVIPFVLLMNNTPLFKQLFDLLLRVSLFEEALRFVFTKFSILLTFSYALFFSLALSVLIEKANKLNRTFIISISVASLVFICFPMFQGKLISDKVRVAIPSYYFDFWDYMKTQSENRVLTLPLNTFTGWQYYDWNYQGSGFIWFGLKQPVLDRDSDRWSSQNEESYREFRYSLYSQDRKLLEKVLDKYNIGYIVWDKSVTTTEEKNRSEVVFTRETDRLIKEMIDDGILVYDNTFGSIEIYKLKNTDPVQTTKTIQTNVQPSYLWNYKDFAYITHGDYYTQVNAPGAFYPFRTFITPTDRADGSVFSVDPQTNSFFINPKTASQGTLTLPSLVSNNENYFANLYVQKSSLNTYLLSFDVLIGKNIIPSLEHTINLKPIDGRLDLNINNKQETIDVSLLGQDPLYIDQVPIKLDGGNSINGDHVELTPHQTTEASGQPQLYSKLPLQQDELLAKNIEGPLTKNEDGVDVIRLTSTNDQGGVFIPLDTLSHQNGYLLGISAANKSGLPLRLCLKNLYSATCDLYDELSRTSSLNTDYFIIPPSGDEIGYGLSLDNISYGDSPTINELEKVIIIPFPYSFLSGLYYDSPQQTSKNIVVFDRSYSPGWKAYTCNRSHIACNTLPFLFGKELKSHVLINNWANGWEYEGCRMKDVGCNTKVTIVFWPQYLEFIGFGILAAVIIYVLIKRP